MKRMRYLLFVIMLLLLLPVVGCDNEAQRRARQAATAQMDHAQELMEQDADSALAILQAVDSAALTDRPAKARYSLLMGRAIDRASKLTDFNVIEEAVNYYSQHGSPTEKMLTLYCQGAIYDNFRENFKALYFYSRAVKEGEKSNDLLNRGLALCAQGAILYRLKKWNEYLPVNQQAAELFRQVGDSTRYYYTLLRIAVAYSRKGDFDTQIKYLRKVRKEFPNMTEKMWKLFYYPELMFNYQQSGNKDSLQATIDEYLINVKNINANDSLDFVGAYSVMKLPAEARRYLPLETADTSFSYHKRWVGAMAYLLEVEGDSKSALTYQERFNAMEDSVKNRNMAQGVEELKDRFEIEQQSLKKDSWLKTSLIWVGILAAGVVVAIVLVIIFRRRSVASRIKYLKTSQDNDAMTQALTESYDQLEILNAELAEISKDRDKVEKELTEEKNRTQRFKLQLHKDRSALNKYIDSLNKIMVACQTKGGYYNEIATETVNKIIASKGSLLSHAQQLYNAKYPYNVEVLKNLGLSEQELNICYLIDFGMQIKHIEKFLGIGNAYNITNAIREKLGVAKSKSKLKTWLAQDLTNFTKPNEEKKQEAEEA